MRAGPSPFLSSFSRRPMWLQFFILASLASGLAFLIAGVILSKILVDRTEKDMAGKAMNVALSVASIPDVRDNVGIAGGAEVIQPIAEEIRERTGVEYVVVFDLDDIRYSHPVPERIGRKTVGSDHSSVLLGKTGVIKARGTLGPALKSMAPIFRDGRVVGGVTVGILLNDVREVLLGVYISLFEALLVGLSISLVGAVFLAWSLNGTLGGREPHEVLRVFQEWEGLLESAHEGILAVDAKGRIKIVNESARESLGFGEEVMGRSIDEVLPLSILRKVLETGEPRYDQEVCIRDVKIVVNCVPVLVRGRIVGAISTFRDMTELYSLAEQITGVKMYAEALRVHNHEFRNKLHTIAGLIHMDKGEEALSFITGTRESWQAMTTFVACRVKNPSVGGILMGKIGRCRELGVELTVDPDSYCGPSVSVGENRLVIIIGNLLDNAIEAVLSCPRGDRRIDFSIFDESGRILICVRDNGCGIPPENRDRLFERGFSTKGEHGTRGYGLFNVQNAVEACGGEISAESEEGRYTEFLVNIPNGQDEEETVESHTGFHC